jgi:hypothetical protein
MKATEWIDLKRVDAGRVEGLYNGKETETIK